MNFSNLFTRPSLIGAHRGASSFAPENTLKALQMSVGRCDFIEIDVQLSKDLVPIIIHDDTLQRTTNVANSNAFKNRHPYKVCDFTFDELSTLDYGEGESILTLSKALSFIKENGLFLNLEIKDMKENFSDEAVVGLILKEIIALEVEERILISSFRHEYLSLCKSINENVLTAALVEEKHPENLVRYLNELGVNAYNMSDKLVDEEVVQRLKKAGFFVNVYTVNDKRRQKELFEIGVNGVFSDYL